MRASEVVELIKWLPDDSAYAASQQGGLQYKGWGYDRYLAARAANEAILGNYFFLMANRDPKKERPKQPRFMPLPGDKASSAGPAAARRIRAAQKANAAQADDMALASDQTVRVELVESEKPAGSKMDRLRERSQQYRATDEASKAEGLRQASNAHR